MSVFLCFYVLFAVCVSGPLWTDFQINGMEKLLANRNCYRLFRVLQALAQISCYFFMISLADIIRFC